MVVASRRVLVTHPFEPALVQRLRDLSPSVSIQQCGIGELSDEQWHNAEVLYTLGTLPMPGRAPNLRWVQFHFAGAEHVLEHPLFDTDVCFTTTSGAHAIQTAEYVLTMMLAWTHQVRKMVEWQTSGHWPSDKERWPGYIPQELYEKTVGIVGYGSIGRQVARLAKAFGMRVVTMQRDGVQRDRGAVLPGVGDPEGLLPDRRYVRDELHAMLRDSDIVVLLVPLTSETRGLIDEAAIGAFKPTALLVNAARGGVCDEVALIDALREGRLAGAVLDVFQEEPLPPSFSPLWRMSNVLMSPHCAGFTPRYNERAMTIFADNLRRYLNGEPLLNLISKTLGY